MNGLAPLTGTESRQSKAAVTGLLLLFFCFAAATMLARGVLVERFFHDIYVPLDLIWRSALGQTPHVDFHMAIGQAFTWPYRLALLFEEPGPLIILRGNLVVGGLLLLLAMLTLPGRLRPLLLFIATAGIIATAMSPRDHDSFWYVYSHLAPYTRWGFALAMLTALITLLPRHDPQVAWRADLADGVVLGASTALLFYLKLNFFIAALGFIVLGLLLQQFRLRAAAWAALTAFAIGAGVGLLVDNNGAYLADVGAAAAANRQGLLLRLFGRDFFQAAFLALIELGAGLILLRLGDPAGNFPEFLRHWWRELALFVGMIGIVVVVHTQNNYTREIPLLSTAFLLLVELQRRRVGTMAGAGASLLAGWRPRLSIALIAIWGVGLHLMDGLAIVSHSVQTQGADAQSIPALRGTAGEGLLVSQQLMRDFPDRPELRQPQDPAAIPGGLLQRRQRWRALTAMEVRSIGEAATMLKPVLSARPRIFSVDFGNPFPAFFRLPPPSGTLPWWDPGRSYSAEAHPDFQVLFGSTDIVMRKRVDTFAGVHSVSLWSLIEPEVERRFRVNQQGPLWTMYVRPAPLTERLQPPPLGVQR